MGLGKKGISVIVVQLLLIVQCCYSQIDSYTHNIKEATGSIDITKLYQLVTKRDNIHNIFLLSESDHRYKSLDTVRTNLIKKMIVTKNPEKVYYENTWEHETLLYDYFDNKIDTLDYKEKMISKYISIKLSKPDSSNFPYYEDIRREYSEIKEDNYTFFLKSIDTLSYRQQLMPIDIGTQTIWLGLYHLSKITKKQNLSNNSIINNFLDSIRVTYQWSFSRLTMTIDDETLYRKHKQAIEDFLSALKNNIKNVSLINAWENVFATYIQANFYRELSVPITYGGKSITSKEYAHKNSFRDSVLYRNFKFFLPEAWKNIILSFSTVHLMDTRNHKDFADVIDASANTIGKYLHKDFAPYLRRIAFVCYDAKLKLPEYDNAHYKGSLEYKLSKQYDYAYVDLYSYRNSVGSKQPFYMRPTFSNFRKLNWEQIFDGIVFIKNCGCAAK